MNISKAISIVFLIFGLFVIPFSYLANNQVSLTALGIIAIILAVISAGLLFISSHFYKRSLTEFRIVTTLAIIFSVINLFLAFRGETNVFTYFLVNSIAYLIVTLLYTNLNFNLRSSLAGINAGIFVVFLIIMGVKIAETLKISS